MWVVLAQVGKCFKLDVAVIIGIDNTPKLG